MQGSLRDGALNYKFVVGKDLGDPGFAESREGRD